MYVQDSWGMGHIQRVSKLMRTLEDSADCLVFCGHREAGWIVPEKCEYIRLPSLNIPLSKSSGVFWGRHSYIQMSTEEALTFRKRVLREALDAFDPDILIVEHRPFGMMDELEDILPHIRAQKIFLTRGLISSPAQLGVHYLQHNQLQALESDLFKKVLVAVDRHVWDVAQSYNLSSALASKFEYVGYMSEPVSTERIEHTRAQRGVPDGAQWVVCSVGGGALGEPIIEECLRIASTLNNTFVDVILGPHTTTQWENEQLSVIEKGSVRIHRECRFLPLLHAAADVVVCAGGYNSITEVMEGGAHIITTPVQVDASDDEQKVLVARLAEYYPITVLGSVSQLQETLTSVVSTMKHKQSIRERHTIDFDGLIHARNLILSLVTPGHF